MKQPKTQLEITIKALFIGIILSIIFCGTNVYLGMKIGQTISASIPASIIAMGFLRMFKKYSILENSIAQTTASTGESAAVVIIFVFPALLILNVWNQFDYLSIIMVGIPGTIIGVIYSIILRKILLDDKTLTFPEGQAIGKLLLTTEGNADNKKDIIALAKGMIVSAILNVCQVGLQVFSGSIIKVFQVGKTVFGGGISFSSAIIGAGYLVGFNPMLVSFVAMMFGWTILLPVFVNINGLPEGTTLLKQGMQVWSSHIRPTGIGVMLFSGFATILLLLKPIIHGIRESFEALKNIGKLDEKDKDLNIVKMFGLLLIVSIPIVFVVFNQIVKLTILSSTANIFLAIALTLILLIVGFIIAAVAGYFAGLLGSTNSPVSGLMFIAVIIISLMTKYITQANLPNATINLFATIVLLVGFIGFTASVTNGSIQDYKSGGIVGSAPYKQQIALFVGIVVSMLIAPIFINLVFNAYGIAGIVPHPGIDPDKTLSAPQATAVATLAKNIIGGTQNWNLIGLGMLFGLVALLVDLIGKKTGKFRCSGFSVGAGLYLPPDLITALFIGGLLRLLVLLRQKKLSKIHGKDKTEKTDNKVGLFVCGLVAGESLMGLILAIPFVIAQNSDALKIVNDNFNNIALILSFAVTAFLLQYTYKLGTKIK